MTKKASDLGAFQYDNNGFGRWQWADFTPVESLIVRANGKPVGYGFRLTLGPVTSLGHGVMVCGSGAKGAVRYFWHDTASQALEHALKWLDRAVIVVE